MKYLVSLVLLVVHLNTAQAASLGRIKQVQLGNYPVTILANLAGQTLYTFDPDSATSSNCNGVCAEKWPPYLISEEEARTLSGGLGVITRASGLLQLTYLQKPLYTFFLDRVDADLLGSELGSVWHIVKMN